MPQLILGIFVCWLIYKIVVFIIEVIIAIGPTVLNIVAGLVACVIALGCLAGAYFAIYNYVRSFFRVMKKRCHGSESDGTNAV